MKFKILLSLLALGLMLSSCVKLYEDVVITEVEKVVIRRVNDEGLILTADITMNNPNRFEVIVENSDLKVMTNDKILGVANILEEVKIPSQSNQTHRFVIETKFSQMVLENLAEVMGLAMKDSIDVRLRGDVRARALMFSNTVHIDVRERVKF